MAMRSTVHEHYGLGTVTVECSFAGNGSSAISAPAIRDGRSSVVSSVARSNTGIYTITFSEAMGQLICGTVGLELASVDDKVATAFNYNASTKVLTIWTYDLENAGASALADPAAGSRIHFRGTFQRTTSLQQ